jgi:glycosyltransferase involved in cell wall biosynthesis
MIEAMACGTRVLAFRCGSIPEIIENGVTGEVVRRRQALATAPRADVAGESEESDAWSGRRPTPFVSTPSV